MENILHCWQPVYCDFISWSSYRLLKSFFFPPKKAFYPLEKVEIIFVLTPKGYEIYLRLLYVIEFPRGNANFFLAPKYVKYDSLYNAIIESSETFAQSGRSSHASIFTSGENNGPGLFFRQSVEISIVTCMADFCNFLGPRFFPLLAVAAESIRGVLRCW